MLAGLAIFVPLEWSRFGLWLVAILLGGGASAAAGAALGAAAREVRAVSLLAFMVTLPVAFLSLVPAGTVGHGLYDVIKVIAALFPFKPALEALTAALESGNGTLGGPLLHLAILIVAYGLIARARAAPLRPRLGAERRPAARRRRVSRGGGRTRSRVISGWRAARTRSIISGVVSSGKARSRAGIAARATGAPSRAAGRGR